MSSRSKPSIRSAVLSSRVFRALGVTLRRLAGGFGLAHSTRGQWYLPQLAQTLEPMARLPSHRSAVPPMVTQRLPPPGVLRRLPPRLPSGDVSALAAMRICLHGSILPIHPRPTLEAYRHPPIHPRILSIPPYIVLPPISATLTPAVNRIDRQVRACMILVTRSLPAPRIKTRIAIHHCTDRSNALY